MSIRLLKNGDPVHSPGCLATLEDLVDDGYLIQGNFIFNVTPAGDLGLEVMQDALYNGGFNIDFFGKKLLQNNEWAAITQHGMHLINWANDSNWKTHILCGFVRSLYNRPRLSVEMTTIKRHHPGHMPTSYYLLAHYTDEGRIGPYGVCRYGDESLLNNANIPQLFRFVSFHEKREELQQYVVPLREDYAIISNVLNHGLEDGEARNDPFMQEIRGLSSREKVEMVLTVLDKLLQENQKNAEAIEE